MIIKHGNEHRPTEPDYLVKWRQVRDLVRTPPRCCHTCDHYDRFGVCEMANARPPVEFVNYGSAECENYSEELPF